MLYIRGILEHYLRRYSPMHNVRLSPLRNSWDFARDWQLRSNAHNDLPGECVKTCSHVNIWYISPSIWAFPKSCQEAGTKALSRRFSINRLQSNTNQIPIFCATTDTWTPLVNIFLESNYFICSPQCTKFTPVESTISKGIRSVVLG